MPAPERSRRTVVKVCGITRLEDASVAVEAGADWLGFVFYGESPRRIEIAAAAEIIHAYPQAVGVAVMVAPTPDEALATARAIGAQRLQIHRSDPGVWPDDFPVPVAFAVPVTREGRFEAPLPEQGALVLLDAAHAVYPGGTGRTFDWETAAALAAQRPVMLAGGLDPDNVATAVERVRPFGVDAASRLESAPGVKDADLVRRFVAAVRIEDARCGAA